MCGIVGYVGHREASEFLLEGLRRLEYRGYDSAGVAIADEAGHVSICKTTGRIERLASALASSPLSGTVGIGHTRWATHGPPTEGNAHPHVGGDRVVTLCHNGVIENFQELKSRLESEGYVFQSATDTEVVAHLVTDCLEKVGADDEAKDAKEPHKSLVTAVKAAR